MTTAGYGHYEIEGHIEEIIPILETKFGSTFTRCYEHQGHCILAILHGQRFSAWSGSETAVSIILRPEHYLVNMEVIGYAGGAGLANLDWGRNKSIVHYVANYLTSHGFKITRTYFTELPQHLPPTHKHYPRTQSLPTAT
jgi:hypothetical protein